MGPLRPSSIRQKRQNDPLILWEYPKFPVLS